MSLKWSSGTGEGNNCKIRVMFYLWVQHPQNNYLYTNSYYSHSSLYIVTCQAHPALVKWVQSTVRLFQLFHCFKYTQVLSKTVQFDNPWFVLVWMVPQEVTSWFIWICHFFSTFWSWFELLHGLSADWAQIDRGLIPHRSSLLLV